MISQLETLLYAQIEQAGLPLPELEYRFHPVRKWRFDFAWPECKIAAEAEGATWSRGRHTRGSGFAKDCEKYNEAALDGWFVFRFTGGMIECGGAIEMLRRVFTKSLCQKA
jgi:hypothetical protein